MPIIWTSPRIYFFSDKIITAPTLRPDMTVLYSKGKPGFLPDDVGGWVAFP